MRLSALKISLVFAALGSISACAHKAPVANENPIAPVAEADEPKIIIFGKPKGGAEASIGVNGFLWRATLDTLNFMPILSADPFGGTFVTDWKASPEKPDERFKIQVFILDTRLRADGIAVQVFRQTQSATGWVDASVDADTPLQIENAILTRARQLRIATLDTNK